MSIWFLGGDARSRYAAEYFQKNGFAVQTYGVPQTADSPLPTKFQVAVLPFPSFAGALLRGKSAIPVEEIIERLQNNTRVFGAVMGNYQERFTQSGAQVYDLYGTEPLTTYNAVPTAEGAICLAIEHSPITLSGSRCLVCGFGRCGKVLAQRLKALGADVRVAARRESELALAKVMQLHTDRIGQWQYGLNSYDFIFNTVPAPLFTTEHSISPDCVFIELASAPGAVSEDAKRNLHYHFAPGLPGKFAPKTAGILYAQSILKIFESEDFP